MHCDYSLFYTLQTLLHILQAMFLSPCYPFITCRFFFWQIKELTEKYAQLEQKLVEMRSKATAEVTSFLDDEIGTKLDKLSRQVARIESRLHTYHEVCITIKLNVFEDIYKPSINQ